MTSARRLLAAAILVVGALGLVVAGASRFGARERRLTSSPTDAITAVEVESQSGPVEVVGSAGGDVNVRRTERYLLGVPTVRQSLTDGVLRLHAQCPRVGRSTCEVRLVLDLPAAVSVRIRAQHGAVSVTGIGGTVDVATGTGAISLTRITGPVAARTATGAVDGVDLAPLFMDASTGSGAIRLSLAEPSARVDLGTRAGAIDVALPPERYRVEARAGAGKADVSVEEEATSAYVVRATTVAGAVRIHPR